MRSALVVVSVIVIAACAAEPTNVECDADPRCRIDGGGCDDACVVRVDCCACLDELICLDDGVDAERCLTAIEAGAVLAVEPGCEAEDDRCGIACAGTDVVIGDGG